MPHVELDRRDGDPVRELVDASAGLDLLVLGSRGHGPLRRLLLGSVSAHVVRHAACPLLLLPQGAEAPAAAAAPPERAGAGA
jgi:nucleotide-binding universal stress UspA family protein